MNGVIKRIGVNFDVLFLDQAVLELVDILVINFCSNCVVMVSFNLSFDEACILERPCTMETQEPHMQIDHVKSDGGGLRLVHMLAKGRLPVCGVVIQGPNQKVFLHSR